MPRTSAQIDTDLSDPNLNPTSNVASVAGVGGGARVQVNLRYEGVQYDPAELIDALRDKYGATKITSDNDVLAGGVLDLVVRP